VKGLKTFILNNPACVGNPEVFGEGFSITVNFLAGVSRETWFPIRIIRVGGMQKWLETTYLVQELLNFPYNVCTKELP
jgi:hypothetical protein